MGECAFSVLVFLLLTSATGAASYNTSGEGVVKAGYWASFDESPASSIDAMLYTHLFYAFASMSTSTYVVSVDPQDLVHFANFTATVRALNPAIETLISIGGEEASGFAAMTKTSNSRKIFIDSSIALAREYGFDGLDLDYEFPQSSTEFSDLGTLFLDWRAAVEAEAKQSGRPALLLTAAVYYSASLIFSGSGTYPIESIADNLNWVNIMCYDYHGSWDVSNTGDNTALYSSDLTSKLTTDYGITSWLKAGLPPSKAVMGLAMYGRSWVLGNKSKTGIGAPAVAAGPPQPISQSSGIFYYSEVVAFIEKSSATVVYDNVTVTAYCFANSVWVTYDNPTSVVTKVEYCKVHQLRGYFFWAVSYDSQGALSRSAFNTWATRLNDSGSASSSHPSSAVLTSVFFLQTAFILLWMLVIMLELHSVLRCS